MQASSARVHEVTDRPNSSHGRQAGRNCSSLAANHMMQASFKFDCQLLSSKKHHCHVQALCRCHDDMVIAVGSLKGAWSVSPSQTCSPGRTGSGTDHATSHHTPRTASGKPQPPAHTRGEAGIAVRAELDNSIEVHTLALSWVVPYETTSQPTSG